MNPELKAKWVAALRSGKYKQTVEYLRTSNGYCCLGILCDVADAGHWDDSGTGFFLDSIQQTLDGDLDYVGDGRMMVAFEIPSVVECQLIEMNDGGKSFTEIADYIESRTDI